MSSRYQYTSMDRVFAKLARDLGSDLNEDDVIEWTGEALEFMQSVKSFEEAVCFAEVKNFVCDMPKWCHAIIQIARDNDYQCSVGVTAFTKTVKEILPSTLVLTEDGEYVTTDNTMQLANNVTLNVNYKVWLDTPWYRGRYTPIRLKDSTLFNTLVCREQSCSYDNCRDEYSIKNGNIIQFSFQEGLVAIPFLRQATDGNGWPLIPDHVSFLTAITKYIGLKMAEREMNSNREGALGKYDRYSGEWQWYCKQASNVDMMPYGIDEHQNLLDQRTYLIPARNKYYGFFGNLATPEQRRFDNSRGNYYVVNG